MINILVQIEFLIKYIEVYVIKTNDLKKVLNFCIKMRFLDLDALLVIEINTFLI